MSRALSYVDRTLRLVFSFGVIALLIIYWAQASGIAMFGLAGVLTCLVLMTWRNLTPSTASIQYRIEQLSCSCAVALLLCAGIGRIDNQHRDILDVLLVAAFAGIFLRVVILERKLRRGDAPRPRESGIAYARRSIRQTKDLWS